MATTTKITKRDLKDDEFIERVFDLGEWLEAHWRSVAVGAGGVVAVILLGVGWNASRASRAVEANAVLARGIAAYAPERRADGTTAPPRYAEALAEFEKAASLGGSRPIGDIARFYRARALMALNRQAEAVPVLESLSSSDAALAAQAKVSLAEAVAAGGDLERAAGLLQEVASATGGSFPPDVALSRLGAIRARQGKNEEARRVYEDLIARFPQGAAAGDARQRLSTLGGAGQAPAAGQ